MGNGDLHQVKTILECVAAQSGQRLRQFHRSQRLTAVKGTVSDLLHVCHALERFQHGAVQERLCLDAADTAAEIDLRQRLTACKRSGRNRFQPIGQGHIFHLAVIGKKSAGDQTNVARNDNGSLLAVIRQQHAVADLPVVRLCLHPAGVEKGILSDAFQRLRQLKAVQIGTHGKGIFSDGFQPRRHFQTPQAGAVAERIAVDSCDRIGDPHIFQHGTAAERIAGDLGQTALDGCHTQRSTVPEHAFIHLIQ